jgi:hypothetical protein
LLHAGEREKGHERVPFGLLLIRFGANGRI